jgi:stage II sporulation protein D
VDGEIRAATKGLGHGLGLSLYGAEAMAKSGSSYKEILKYYYSDVDFVTTVPSE